MSLLFAYGIVIDRNLHAVSRSSAWSRRRCRTHSNRVWTGTVSGPENYGGLVAYLAPSLLYAGMCVSASWSWPAEATNGKLIS